MFLYHINLPPTEGDMLYFIKLFYRIFENLAININLIQQHRHPCDRLYLMKSLKRRLK